MLRAIDRALTVRRLMKLCVRTGTRRLFGLIAYVFAILATCQHYGRRTEPDDRAPLFIRRQPMSMGSCTLAC
jgi:hypothetical protein